MCAIGSPGFRPIMPKIKKNQMTISSNAIIYIKSHFSEAILNLDKAFHHVTCFQVIVTNSNRGSVIHCNNRLNRPLSGLYSVRLVRGNMSDY